MKKPFLFINFFLISFLISCSTTRISQTNQTELQYPDPSSNPEALEFDEIWGFVMNKHESDWNNQLPVTDIGYFISAVNDFSDLPAVPPKEKFFSDTSARVHLVSSVDSRAQTHLLLSPEYSLRNKIIEQLIKASETYDGLQIDWELVMNEDSQNFIDFLKILKSKLGSKSLSIAIPARTKTLQRDAYNYEKISAITDKVIIMAYDQHWSTSEPGPIADNDWCKKIMDYAKTQIPPEKLVMGMSFYGRAWRDDTEGGKAYIYTSTENLIEKHKIHKVNRTENYIPFFSFTKKITITEWYDDAQSLKVRTKLYADNGITKLSFWRLGQEDKNYWQYLKIKKPAEQNQQAE